MSAKTKHHFLAVDESRGQLHYINQFEPAKSWTISAKTKIRDIQLIGKHLVLLSTPNGFVVYNLINQKTIKTFSSNNLKNVFSAQRLPDNQTLIACNTNGITIFKLDANDKIIQTTNFPTLKQLRLMRVTEKGNIIFGCNNSQIAEVNLKGEILKQISIKSGRHIYQVLDLAEGNVIASLGYGGTISIINKSGEITKSIGSLKQDQHIKPFFYAGFQRLKNHNIVVSHWTGHGKNDSTKAPQILEFNPKGELVWDWHDPKIAGTIHGVIILDQLNTDLLHSEKHGVLQPIKKND